MVEQATYPHIAVCHETLCNPVVDNTNVSGQPEADVHHVEALRSYPDVYKRYATHSTTRRSWVLIVHENSINPMVYL